MAPAVSPRYGYKVVNTRDELTFGLFPAAGSAPVEWRVSDAPVDYDSALEFMTARAEAIARGEVAELVWLLEHPALYTAGTSAQPSELIEARFPVHMTGRGGQFTYHGPGQRVGYVMLDLKRRAPDVRRFVASTSPASRSSNPSALRAVWEAPLAAARRTSSRTPSASI